MVDGDSQMIGRFSDRNHLGGGGHVAGVDRGVCAIGALHRLGVYVRAGTDAEIAAGVVPLTRGGCAPGRDADYSGQFSAGQGARGAQSRHASRSLVKKMRRLGLADVAAITSF
jgi:hypothetical protein